MECKIGTEGKKKLGRKLGLCKMAGRKQYSTSLPVEVAKKFDKIVPGVARGSVIGALIRWAADHPEETEKYVKIHINSGKNRQSQGWRENNRIS